MKEHILMGEQRGNARNKRFCFIKSRDEWTTELEAQFPKGVAELSDSEIVDAIIKHGRANVVKNKDGTLEIEFQNGYD